MNHPRDLATPVRRLCLAVVIAATAWGVGLRLVRARDAFVFGDEFHSLRLIPFGYPTIVRHYQSDGAGLALPLLQRVASDLVGLNHWSLRLPALLGSIGSLLVAYRLGRRFDLATGLGAVLLLATLPFHVFYGHFGRIYGLLSLTALLLLASCARLLAPPPPSRRDYAAVATLTALIPYLHLSATSFVGSLLGATAVLLAVSPDGRRRLRPLILCGAGGLAGAALLHLPAVDSVSRFVGMKTSAEYQGEFGAVDVLTLLGGSRLGAIALATALLIGLGQAIRRRDTFSALLAAGVLGPALGLLIVRPYGDAYAYARYLMPSAALMCFWVARMVALLTAGLRGAWPELTALAPTALLLAFALPGSTIGSDGSHANAYLGLLSLPPFDAPYSGTPSVYHQLATGPPITLIEAPALLNRSRHLYRSFFFAHRQRTVLGFLPQEEPPRIPGGPYLSLARDDLTASGADYLVLHLDVLAEVERYWGFVYALESAEDRGIRAFLERHRSFNLPLARPTPELIDGLRDRLGPPAHQDRELMVWKLR